MEGGSSLLQVSHEEAKVRMAHEPYKLELVRDILAKDPDAKITLYHIGTPPSFPSCLTGPPCSSVLYSPPCLAHSVRWPLFWARVSAGSLLWFGRPTLGARPDLPTLLRPPLPRPSGDWQGSGGRPRLLGEHVSDSSSSTRLEVKPGALTLPGPGQGSPALQHPLSRRAGCAGGADHKQHWYDLCAGPHVESTASINPAAIGLESVLQHPPSAHIGLQTSRPVPKYASAPDLVCQATA